MTTRTTLSLAFTDQGVGDQGLVLLPGWCGDRTLFDEVMEHLGPTHRVMSVDWPGHGESPDAPGDFGAKDLADSVAALAAERGLTRLVPVGMAHAGWVALELRRSLGPVVVPGVVLIDWMFLGPPPPFMDALEALQREDTWESVRAALFAMWTEGLNIPELDRYVAGMGTQGFAMWSRAGREIATAFAREGSPAQAFSRLSPNCRVLHAYAQPDDPHYLAAQQEFAADHPWFLVERLPANSHFPPIEVPADVGRLVGAFADEVLTEGLNECSAEAAGGGNSIFA